MCITHHCQELNFEAKTMGRLSFRNMLKRKKREVGFKRGVSFLLFCAAALGFGHNHLKKITSLFS